MAITKKQELRALTESERELVGMTGVRAARALTDAELGRLVKRLRTRRDRARTVADRQRRELRGKTRPRGAAPTKADDGSQVKLEVLSAALARLETETARRGEIKAKADLVASAKKALALKKQAKPVRPAAKKQGPAKVVRGRARVEVENHVPGSLRGAVRRQNARVQAKRDAR